ncbi:MAG: glycoside hydrolase family 32 protein [Ginsengibacter sp.]
MRGRIYSIVLCVLGLQLFNCGILAQSSTEGLHEAYRPQIHFSPKAHWVNDPNGMVYYKGIYHLFFQYHPGGTTWGPMHWGHATSKDMIHWTREAVALYPDSLGYIFSGSAVVDKNNTSGFGKDGQVPLVAIFTHHDPKPDSGRIDFQNQSLAYSLDNGNTWIKYAKNPVLKNPGIIDFRDPKVMWYEAGKKWIMTLATKDRITFYSSKNLKDWNKESEVGSNIGAHGGVWECPDLFTLDDNGKKVWVLIVNINPGGPNKGSATQYFLGDFDGNKFTPNDTETRWLDYGPDEYAGITWSNTGDRKIFLGWMSNWMYANEVPTIAWRNAMTIPRELKIKHAGQQVFVASEPVDELSKIESKPMIVQNVKVSGSLDISEKTGNLNFPCRIDLKLDEIKDFSLVLSNYINEKLIIGYDKNKNHYFIDRTKSGKTDFKEGFSAIHTAPRFSDNSKMDMTLIIDVSSVELFADDGLSVMSEIFFPNEPYNKINIETQNDIIFKKIEYKKLHSIWH